MQETASFPKPSARAFTLSGSTGTFCSLAPLTLAPRAGTSPAILLSPNS
jgi:hypothetical protein